MTVHRPNLFRNAAAIGGHPGPQAYSSGARTLADETQGVDVRFRIFIPAPVILMDVPILPNRAFSGDGRGFSYDQGTARADLHASVRLRQQGKPSITLHRREWGESHEFNPGDTTAVSGKPGWWRDKATGATPIDSGRLAASSSNLDLTIGGTTTDNIEVTINDATVVTFMADGGLPLVAVSPAINADLRLHLKVEGGRLKAKLVGAHDGFPAYEAYVAGQRIYGYDPVAAGADPSSLFPPEDVDVDTGWIDVGASTFSVQTSWGPGTRRAAALAVPRQQQLLGGLPLLSAATMSAPARQMGGPVALAELGINAITAITDNDGDISWNLQGLDGYFHPRHEFWNEAERRANGLPNWRAPWTFEVFGSMETKAGDEISARIPVSFQGNDHYIANVSVETPSNLNDAWLWDLDITGIVYKNAEPKTRGSATDLAAVRLEFTYHFSSPIHDSAILKLTYWLYANGDVTRNARWTQHASY